MKINNTIFSSCDLRLKKTSLVWVAFFFFVVVWLGFPENVSADTMELSDIPLGKVIAVGGKKFVKISADQYLALERFRGDRIPPVITAVGNPKDNVWTNQSVKITPTVTDEGGSGFSHFLWNVDGGEWRDDWNGVFEGETSGTVIGIKAVDNDDNQSTPVYTTIKIDKTPPRVTLNGDPSISIIRDSNYEELGAVATDNYTENMSVVITGSVDTSVEATYQLIYTATDLAGNTGEARRRVLVVTPTEELYYLELKAIEELVLAIGDNSANYIGTALTEATAVNIRGINYWQDWYLITKADLQAAGYQDTNSSAANYLDMSNANYIVRYVYTPGAVQSIPGQVINGSPVHTFNYFGDPEEETIYPDGILSAVTKDSTKNSSQWGELPIAGGAGTYDEDGGLQLGSQYGVLQIDQTRPVDQKFSVLFTVKGDVPQTTAETFPRTIVAISETSSKYLSWIGIRRKYLHVYSFYEGGALNSIDREDTRVGFISLDLTTIVKEQTPEGPIYYDYNNEYMNIQVTALRGGETNVYINGVLVKTFTSGNAILGYSTMTVGDLRAGRGLKYIGSIYNFALYSEVLDESAVQQNWNYFKKDLGITD